MEVGEDPNPTNDLEEEVPLESKKVEAAMDEEVDVPHTGYCSDDLKTDKLEVGSDQDPTNDLKEEVPVALCQHGETAINEDVDEAFPDGTKTGDLEVGVHQDPTNDMEEEVPVDISEHVKVAMNEEVDGACSDDPRTEELEVGVHLDPTNDFDDVVPVDLFEHAKTGINEDVEEACTEDQTRGDLEAGVHQDPTNNLEEEVPVDSCEPVKTAINEDVDKACSDDPKREKLDQKLQKSALATTVAAAAAEEEQEERQDTKENQQEPQLFAGAFGVRSSANGALELRPAGFGTTSSSGCDSDEERITETQTRETGSESTSMGDHLDVATNSLSPTGRQRAQELPTTPQDEEGQMEAGQDGDDRWNHMMGVLLLVSIAVTAVVSMVYLHKSNNTTNSYDIEGMRSDQSP